MAETPNAPRFHTFEVGGWHVTYGVGLTKPYADVVWASDKPPSAMLGKWAMLHLTAKNQQSAKHNAAEDESSASGRGLNLPAEPSSAGGVGQLRDKANITSGCMPQQS